VLACTGLYGVLSYSVARRTSEIGIRMALGALRTDVIRMVLWEEMAMVLVGVVVGLGLSLGAARVIANRLFGLGATDPVTYLGAIALLIVTAILAGYVPAHRAARVDPLLALRHE